MATVREVAQAAGVSIATVSRVLNNSSVVTDDIRAKVLEAINQCGYVPSVGRRSTAFLGLIYACPFSLGSPYDVSLIEGMGRAMESVDLDLVLLNPQRDKQQDESYTQFFLRKGVRGVILRSTLEGRDICRQIGQEKFPAIVLGDHFDDPTLAFSYADSTESSRQAIQHLITLGHRRIACAANEHEDGDHADRLTAYRSTLEENGIENDERLVCRIPARSPDGAQVLRYMMSLPEPPTAVYLTDPPVAIGLINEARSTGLDIPGDLSVVGFDDRDSRHYVLPCMTAVCQDARQLGYDAFMELARIVQLGGKSLPESRISATWLEINSTTGPPPASPCRVLPDGTRVDLTATTPK